MAKVNAKILEWFKARTSAPMRVQLRRTQKNLKGSAERALRLIYSPRRPTNPDGEVLLNLGSGYVTHPSFINIDALPARHIHYIQNVDNLRPFADQSVDLIYVSHCLEHISYHRVDEVLAEWYRVLKPGGVLRLGVPDFDALLSVYNATGQDIESILPVLYGGQDYDLNAHYSMFTLRSLTARLKRVGFSAVRPWQWGEGTLTSLPDCTALIAHVASAAGKARLGRMYDPDGGTAEPGEQIIPLSLNVEAIR
jgi:predicted SAM-dependent methyltransferase